MWFVPLVAQDSINTSYYWESIKESEKQMLNCSLSYYQWIIFAKSTRDYKSECERRKNYFKETLGCFQK